VNGLASGAAQTTLPWSRYSEPELLRQEQEHDNFFSEDVTDGEIEELIAFDDQVGLEDRALVESVQTVSVRASSTRDS
jgi:hypothetical protein